MKQPKYKCEPVYPIQRVCFECGTIIERLHSAVAIPAMRKGKRG